MRGAVRASLTTALLAWLAAVVVIAALRVGDHTPGIAGFASTPDLIADGHLWTLLTSAMPVSRYPFAEIAGMVAAIWGVWRVAGIGAVWLAGLAAHIGSTLVVYAGIGALWLIDHGTVADQLDRRDYGISAIWLGELGYLAVALWPRNRRAALGVGTASLAVTIGLTPVAGPMATAEHLLSLTIGALLPKNSLRCRSR